MDTITFNKLYLLAAIWELLLCVGVLKFIWKLKKHKIRYNLHRLKYPQHVFSINNKKTEQQQRLYDWKYDGDWSTFELKIKKNQRNFCIFMSGMSGMESDIWRSLCEIRESTWFFIIYFHLFYGSVKYSLKMEIIL